MDQPPLTIPLISTFVFWLIGLSGNWQRALVCFLLSYASVILAFQHFDKVADILNNVFGLSLRGDQIIAAGFGTGMIGALIGLYVLYSVLWRPISSDDYQQVGGVKLLQSGITALTGWTLGVLVAACFLQYSQNATVLYFIDETSFLWNTFQATIKMTVYLVNPWLVHSAPQFLLELGF
jgi:hypothetical protein